jgi:hypothetical protein
MITQITSSGFYFHQEISRIIPEPADKGSVADFRIDRIHMKQGEIRSHEK